MKRSKKMRPACRTTPVALTPGKVEADVAREDGLEHAAAEVQVVKTDPLPYRSIGAKPKVDPGCYPVSGKPLTDVQNNRKGSAKKAARCRACGAVVSTRLACRHASLDFGPIRVS